ncbi:MAG: PLP-dependent aminotransferase family protein [Deltaproteobacteria bacterium]|nr:MAG: PLP-dependent aminotransferase family protein [Deltaproteobacteria bacterium]
MATDRPDQSPTRGDAVASLFLRVDARAARPLHEQIFEGVRAHILSGALKSGARLPSSRQLAVELGVARTTVLQALAALSAEGYVVARRGSATRVASALAIQPEGGAEKHRPGRPRTPRLSRAARLLRTIPGGAPRLGAAPRAFRPGVPALDLFPTSLWARIVNRCHVRASSSLLEGGDPAGHRPLREAIAAHLALGRGVRCTADQVFLTAGTQHGFEEILRLVIDPGDPVWIEEPGYLGARRAALAAGARLVPVPVDGEGLDVRAGIAREPRARAVLLAPSHQYPLGVTMSLPRRLALLRWAAHARAVVIEDDYDSEFRHRGRPLTALQGLDQAGCVVYVGTFSKTMFPGLRLGFVVAPPPLVDIVAATSASAGGPGAAVNQAALARFIADGHFAIHLRRMRAVYRERGEALLAALAAECGGVLQAQPCEAGMQMSALLTNSLADADVQDEAARHGVEVGALSDYYLGRPRSAGLVFGFGGVRPTALRAGTKLLAQTMETMQRTRRLKRSE